MFSFSKYSNLSEAISVKKQNYSWGKMITVHHGSDTSYPLHPEHQAKIKALNDGEKTSFKDETKRTVTAHRSGDTIHLSGAGTSKKTAVDRSHFAEEVEQGELSLETIKIAEAFSRLDSKVNEATSAYDRISNRFKKLSGRSLGTAAKEYGDEVKDLQKKIDAQKAENERRQAALKKEHFITVDETKSAPKGFHFTSDGRLKRGDADVDGPGGKKLRSDPLDKTRSKIPSVSESTPTSQQVKQAIGIARDKRYAKGNVTGAVKAMNKLNPGLAQHPVVKKELQKQNEEKNKDDLPFTPDKPKAPSAMAGKYGLGHSTAKHLARMALSQQIKKKQNM